MSNAEKIFYVNNFFCIPLNELFVYVGGVDNGFV